MKQLFRSRGANAGNDEFMIGAPQEFKRKAHVDENWNWSGGDGEEGFTQFEPGKDLGQGAYGRVFQGEHKESGFVLAVKSMNNLGPAKKAIQKEIEILKGCSHNNIVQYYGSCVKGRELWILMEFCSGGAINDLTEKIPDKQLTELQIAAVLRDSVKGLVYLHNSKIIHRDMKAANILINEQGVCKLADFGVSAKQETSKNQTVVGTPLYMSPEILQGSSYDESCDIWSLGITAIELAEGHPPYFDEENMFAAIEKIAKGDPPKLADPKKYIYGLPQFVEDCCQKDPRQRPTIKELVEHKFIKQISDDNSVMSDLMRTLGLLKENSTGTFSSSSSDEISLSGSGKGMTAKKKLLQSTSAANGNPSNSPDNTQKSVVVSGPKNLVTNNENKQLEQMKEMVETYRQQLRDVKRENKRLKKQIKKISKDVLKAKEQQGKEPVGNAPAVAIEEVSTSDPAQLKKMDKEELIKKIKLLEAQNRSLVQGKQQADSLVKVLLGKPVSAGTTTPNKRPGTSIKGK